MGKSILKISGLFLICCFLLIAYYYEASNNWQSGMNELIDKHNLPTKTQVIQKIGYPEFIKTDTTIFEDDTIIRECYIYDFIQIKRLVCFRGEIIFSYGAQSGGNY